ncbi:phage replisome organizer N-terminal domain-containing protein [Streptococcus thoraltensis]
MADIKWIKITTDIFNDDKIRLIETMPEGDTLLVIWLKLLTLAGKQNQSGFLMMSDKIAFTDEMLATIFRRHLTIVRLALNTFEQFGMIEVIDNRILISNWEKHQNIDGMDRIREKTRQRVAKHREKLKLSDSNVTCNVTVTHGNATDKDKEKDKEKNNIYSPVSDETKDDIPYKEIVDYLNDKAKTNYRASGKDTKSHIKARWSEGFNLDDFKTVIDKQVARWTNTEYQQYLRPKTLFGTKFESYLNSPEPKKSYVNEYPEDMPF